jgi:hypothetical protein
VERAFSGEANDAIFAGQPYYGCIASSANISGEPSIVDREAALASGREGGVRVPLTDRTIPARYSRGSQSMYWLKKNEVRLMRRRALVEEVAVKLHRHLQPIVTVA